MPSKTKVDFISFNVIAALVAYTETGELDEERAQGYIRLFLLDKGNCVELHSFVETCHKIYKEILFLSASMANSEKLVLF